jgi:hypothetical protein
MPKYLYSLPLIFVFSCGQIINKSDKIQEDKNDSANKNHREASQTIGITGKTVKFLWRAKKYDQEIKDSINEIFIDEEFCKTITDPEKAAIAYVATFVGNDCWWDGEASDNRSNLKCKILTALDLGYQCSDKHLGFLRKWFRNDKKSLMELDNCPTIPNTSTIQDTFDEITLTVNGNKLTVNFKGSGFNTREEHAWSWTEIDYFEVDNDKIKLIKQDKSKFKKESY